MPTIHSIPLRSEFYALSLLDYEKKSIRTAAQAVGVAKSTLHDNLAKYRADVAAFEKFGERSQRDLVRNIMMLSLECKASSRDCAKYLSHQTGQDISHQYVLSVLGHTAEVASRKNDERLKLDPADNAKDVDSLPLAFVKSAAFDEIFQKQLPILGFADPVSSVIYLESASDRGEKSWTEFLEKLRSLGLNPDCSITDGALGLLKSIKQVFGHSEQFRDLFHVLQKLSKALKAFEGKCYGLIAAFDRAVKASTDPVSLADLKMKMERAILIFDALERETKTFQKACYLASDNGYTESKQTAIIIDRIVALISCAERNGIQHDAIKAARTYLSGAKCAIVAYKARIERIVGSQFGDIHAATIVGFICPIIECLDQIQRSYENNKRLAHWTAKLVEARGRFRQQGFIDQAEVDRAIDACAKIMGNTKKSNSLIEAINSVIRRHLTTYKSIPTWFCPIFTFYWNHRTYRRGKRRGLKPREILTGRHFEKDWVEVLLDEYPFESKSKPSTKPQIAVAQVA